MKSNQKLKQEARTAFDNESRFYKVIGGQHTIVNGKQIYVTFKDAYTKAIKQKNITTKSIREAKAA